MTEAPISTPPHAYMGIINPLIDKARGFLEAGERLQATAFLGNLATKEVIAVMIQAESGEDKGRSARLIQSAALALDADFVFAIMEAWTLRPDKICQMNAIIDKYGSIGASPYAIDTCALTLETRPIKGDRRDSRQIYQVAYEDFGHDDLTGFTLAQVNLVIRIAKQPHRRAHNIAVQITSPNGLNDKSKTEDDRRKVLEQLARLDILSEF